MYNDVASCYYYILSANKGPYMAYVETVVDPRNLP